MGRLKRFRCERELAIAMEELAGDLGLSPFALNTRFLYNEDARTLSTFKDGHGRIFIVLPKAFFSFSDDAKAAGFCHELLHYWAPFSGRWATDSMKKNDFDLINIAEDLALENHLRRTEFYKSKFDALDKEWFLGFFKGLGESLSISQQMCLLKV